jgi:CRISPR-associated protein Csm5
MALNMRYKLTLTTLTPLHVGSGVRLLQGLDFLAHDGALWIADQGKLMEAVLQGLLEAAALKGRSMEQVARVLSRLTLDQLVKNKLLTDEHFDLTQRYFRYRLAGGTSAQNQRGELHEFIKDAYGQPYLPGSSFKGALRSVLLRRAAADDDLPPEIFYWEIRRRGKIEYDAQRAAQKVEQRHFKPAGQSGSDFPHFDEWRGVQPSDFFVVLPARARGSPAARPLERLALANGRIYPASAEDNQANKGIRLDMEVLLAGETLSGDLRIQRWYFEDQRAARLKFTDDFLQRLTDKLCELANEDARLALEDEQKEFLDKLSDLDETGQEIARQYKTHLKYLGKQLEGLRDNEFMLRLGKGTGWRDKTLGGVLIDQLYPDEFERMVKRFELGGSEWNQDGRVPLTRLLASAGGQQHAPLGWVKVKMEPQG